MPEKLLNIKETSAVLNLSEDQIRALVAKGELPAYKIGGQFLRFRKEQIEAIRKEIVTRPASRGLPGQRRPKKTRQPSSDSTYQESFREKLFDFFYFQDFYIISALAILLLLLVILKS